MTNYMPLNGIKVLDLGILVPAALASGKLAALGADVVKVEQPPAGDRIRLIPPYADDGKSPQHMAQNWGKRSIGLDAKTDEGRESILALIDVADVIVENQLAGFWAQCGIDFIALRARRPELIVCSITGFGQSGPWSRLPAHGLNMDALGDGLNVEWKDGQPHLGWAYTSWGNELGATSAALAVCAALISVKAGGPGEWIDVSCWDALVETHRTEIAMTQRTGQPFSLREMPAMSLYTTYAASDGRPVMFGALEPKFWRRFCEGIGRDDLVAAHDQTAISFADNALDLRKALEAVFATATSDEWLQRFLDWDIPGGPVYDVPAIMQTAHYSARQLVEGDPGSWPQVKMAFRWQKSNSRAGSGLTPPPEFNQDEATVRAQWLSEVPCGGTV
ncbi:CaiB/BaiF CoA-transferase family protein [Mycobacterium sp. URHB0044]|jgi:alpha-methylacyl-CoA racemase|uniref:CaiB/BaiF CoA transferase family protein n=1 Tax=Mycobacterium sp. URHB0044 TaxID=1380386 RepID=UPI00048E33DE|nr:CoA transferase [Mycobacterium sp. URHB0044]